MTQGTVTFGTDGQAMLNSIFGDDGAVGFGSGSPGQIVWDTSDANANLLKIEVPTGGAVDVPVVLAGIGHIGVDLGLFNGVTQPTLGVLDADRDSWLVMEFSGDDAARLRANRALTITNTAGAITITPTTDLILHGGLNFINDTANPNQTIGLTINMGANSDHVLTFKHGNLTHGLETNSVWRAAETDDFALFSPVAGANGGLLIEAFTADVATDDVLVLSANGGTATTAKTTSGRGLIQLYAQEHNGGNARANITADGNILSLTAYVGGAFVNRLLIDEDGDVFVVTVVDVTGTGNAVTATAFDEYEDDAALLDTWDNLRAPATAIRQDWAEWVGYNEDTLIEADILGAPIGDGGMTNMTQLQRAEIGALRQTVEDLMSVVRVLPTETWRYLTPRIQRRLRVLEAA